MGRGGASVRVAEGTGYGTSDARAKHWRQVAYGLRSATAQPEANPRGSGSAQASAQESAQESARISREQSRAADAEAHSLVAMYEFSTSMLCLVRQRCTKAIHCSLSASSSSSSSSSSLHHCSQAPHAWVSRSIGGNVRRCVPQSLRAGGARAAGRRRAARARPRRARAPTRAAAASTCREWAERQSALPQLKQPQLALAWAASCEQLLSGTGTGKWQVACGTGTGTSSSAVEGESESECEWEWEWGGRLTERESLFLRYTYRKPGHMYE